MRAARSWGVTAALIVGLGGAVAAADGPDNDGKPAAPKGLLSGLFGSKSKAPAPPDLKPIEDQIKTLPVADTAAAARQRHINAFLRRLSVCQRLKDLAVQSGNEALMNQAEELEAHAQAIFYRDTNGLPAPAPAVLRKPREAGEPNHVLNTMADDRSAPPSMPRRMDTHSLDGNMDQREQAILNGSSMEGMKP